MGSDKKEEVAQAKQKHRLAGKTVLVGPNVVIAKRVEYLEKEIEYGTMDTEDDADKNASNKEVPVNDKVKRIDEAYPTQKAVEKEREAGRGHCKEAQC